MNAAATPEPSRDTAHSALSVILPAYQLEATIADNLRTVVRALPEAEVIAVDDGSTDGTWEAMSAVDGVTALRHSVNQGKGAALRTGFAASTAEVIVFLDGDLDLPAEQVPDFVAEMRRRGVDVLVGAKHEVMHKSTYPLKRRILSKIFSAVTGLLFRLPIQETQTGLKAFRRPALEAGFREMKVTRYAFDLDLLVRIHRSGFSMAQTPVVLRPGASSAPLPLAILWEMARDTLRVLWWSVRS